MHDLRDAPLKEYFHVVCKQMHDVGRVQWPCRQKLMAKEKRVSV